MFTLEKSGGVGQGMNQKNGKKKWKQSLCKWGAEEGLKGVEEE